MSSVLAGRTTESWRPAHTGIARTTAVSAAVFFAPLAATWSSPSTSAQSFRNVDWRQALQQHRGASSLERLSATELDSLLDLFEGAAPSPITAASIQELRGEWG